MPNQLIQSESIQHKRWGLLQIESSLTCNLRCIMCPWKDINQQTKPGGFMSQETWESIRPHLSEAQSIDFTGGGEPLLQPNLIQWVREAHQAGCQTGILTNGLLLKKELSQKLIDAGLSWLGVSMDGATPDVYEQIRKGSSFQHVCDNLTYFNNIRTGNYPKTMINFVLMPLNFHQVEGIVRLARQLGVDHVNFKQCEVIRGEHGKGYGLFRWQETKDTKKLAKSLRKARRLAKKKLGIITTAFPFIPEELPVCDQDPRASLFIRHDGVVAPCINLAIGGRTTFFGREVIMPNVHYGRIADTDLLKLWKSQLCKLYRERFQKRCHAHEKEIIAGLIDPSFNRQKRLEAARAAMPEPPTGCEICHYLYNI